MGTDEAAVEQAAVERRERIKALKAAQQLLNTPDDDINSNNNNNNNNNVDDNNNDDDTSKDNNLSVKFRNYVPQAKELQEGKLAPPVLPKFEDPVAAAAPISENNEGPFVNIAPKKPNLDLRRDVQKKLDKLERRTQKAIYKLMEEQEREKQLGEDDGSVVED